MKYPHYTYDGCYWFAYRSDQSRTSILDGLSGACGIDNEEYRATTVVLRPGPDEKRVSKADFMAAYRRISKRLLLLLEDKNDSHLEIR